MDIVWQIVVFIVQAAIVFLVSTLLFDGLHYLLHRWQNSPNKWLRMFSRWHWVHHKFLTPEMKIDPAYRMQNIWLHVLPEYGTSMAGTLLFFFFMPWEPVAFIVVIRTIMVIVVVWEEGMDFNHMQMDRVSGKFGLWWVGKSYHAMHHIFPNSFYSSFLNIFDVIFAKGCQIEGRRFLITGASGAFGSAMKTRLERMGGIVETAKSGVDFSAGDYERMREKLERADVLVLSHGAKSEDCWNANYTTFVDLIEMFRAIGEGRLTPPEVWGLGSEVELHGDMGMAELRDYAASKRAFAVKARQYDIDQDILYRHIVPSAFTSAMGKGMMSAEVAVGMALFFIRRGFTYVPVTLTTLAYWNYIRFRLLKPDTTVGPDQPQPAGN